MVPLRFGSNGVPVKLKEGNMVTVNGIRGREIVFVGNVRPEGVEAKLGILVVEDV